jgi:hypothetical protein
MGPAEDVAAVVVAAIASPSDAAPSDSVEISARPGDTATAASSESAGAAAVSAVAPAQTSGEGEGTSPAVERASTPAAIAAMSEGAASSGDAAEGGSGVVAIQQAVAAISAGAAARQPTSLDPTPWDEGTADAVAEAPALEQTGGGGTLLVAAAAAAGVGAGGAVPVVPSAGPATGTAAAPASAAGGAWVSGSSDPSPVGEFGPDRSLVASVDATSLPNATTVGRSAAPRTIVDPAEEPSLAVDCDGDAAGVAAKSQPVEEPAPPPRCADLLTDFLPFDRAALEGAIDQFLAPFEGLHSEPVNWRSPSSLLPAATLVVTAALAWAVARRRARANVAGREERQEDLARVPGYPLAWSFVDP